MLEFIRKANISLKKKNNVYAVTVIDKELLEYNKEKIDQQTEEIRLQIKLHINNILFNIIITEQYKYCTRIIITQRHWFKDKFLI